MKTENNKVLCKDCAHCGWDGIETGGVIGLVSFRRCNIEEDCFDENDPIYCKKYVKNEERKEKSIREHFIGYTTLIPPETA